MSKGYAGISAPKIEILEWYVKKGGKAGFFHDLPTDVQIRLQMGYVHELLEQDVNRWLQDHGHNPHMEPPDWLAAEEYEVDVYGPYGGRYTGTIREKEKNAESFGVDSADVEEEPCPHCNGEGSCEWCDGEGCRHCGYVEGDCEWCGGTGFEAESKLHPGLYRYKGKIGMRKGWTECQECDDIVKQKDVNWYYIKGYGQATVCDACVGKYNYKKDRLSKGQRHGELAILLMQKEDEEMGAESFNADEIEETDQEIAESVLFSCDDCDSIYGGGEGEVLICSRLGQKGHYNHCENCCSGSETFSAEYRPKWKEEKKHHRSNPTYTCSFQIREYNRGEYEGEYEEHKLQIQKVKGKWVVHELDTRYVTPNARLIKDRYNKEEYWRPISDPYDTVDEAKKSVVEEITQSKCQHDDGYRLADPTQIFYDSHEYVDFVCVKCGAIGYGDMGENDFRGIDTRWAEGEESKWVKISAILTQDYFADLKEGDESWNDVEWEIDTYDQREKAIFGQGAVGQSWDETIRYNRDAESFAASWPFSKRKKQERIIGRIGGEYGPIWDEKKYDGERWEDVGRLYQDKEQLFKVLGTDKCSVCENKLFHNYRKYDPSDAYRKYDPSDSNPPVICGNCFSEETKKSDIYYENPRKPGQGVIRRPAEKKVFHPVDGLNPPCSCKYCQYNLDFVKRLKDGHPLIDSTFDKYSRCLWCEHKYEDDDRLDRLMAFHQPAPHEPYVVCDRCYEYEETDKEWDETIRYNRDAESFATEGRTFKCGGCWRELPLKERSRKRKESMGQEEMCRPCMKMSDADYVDSLIEQGGMDEYDRVVKELYGDWDLRFNEPEICSVCGERGGHICFEAESFSAPYPRKKGDYYNRCNDCDGDILEDQYQRETTYTRQYCVDSKRGKSTCGMDEEWEETEESYAESTDRVFPSKAVEAKADLALIGAGAIVGLLIGGIIVRDR